MKNNGLGERGAICQDIKIKMTWYDTLIKIEIRNNIVHK